MADFVSHHFVYAWRQFGPGNGHRTPYGHTNRLAVFEPLEHERIPRILEKGGFCHDHFNLAQLDRYRWNGGGEGSIPPCTTESSISSDVLRHSETPSP